MQQIDGVERQTGDSPSLAIIWLHGLGADASDFLPIIDELELPDPTRFVFPNAPIRSVTINGGMRMRAWYDILGFRPDAPEDTAGLAQSVGIVRNLIRREAERGIEPDRILLAGFSQGGAVVLHAGLTASPPVAGIVGLSTYLPAPSLLAPPTRIAADTPVLLAHGTSDLVLPLTLAESSAAAIRNLGVTVDWSTWPMGHEVSFEEIRYLNGWLRRFRARHA